MPAVSVQPELLEWAIDRSGLPRAELAKRFPKLDEWTAGEREPTLRQLEAFAKKTRTPFGYLLLKSPPEERLPVPDYRTPGDVSIERPSPDLIDTIHIMQRRQDWMREFVREQGQDPLPFVGAAVLVWSGASAPRRTRVVAELADEIRTTLGLVAGWAEKESTFEDALRRLRDAIEQAGVLVAVNGVVGNNTHRPLNPQEFRGFVLPDEYVPLIFVNGNDSKSAQMFTLAHELVHVWLGEGGVFNLINAIPSADETEQFCNTVAAEFLVPAEQLHERWSSVPESGRLRRIARQFKVSPVAAARRALDLKFITRKQFFAFYARVQDEWRKSKEKAKDGGDFYRTASTRLGRRFATSVVIAAKSGRLPYHEAYRLTGMKARTYHQFESRTLSRVEHGG